MPERDGNVREEFLEARDALDWRELALGLRNATRSSNTDRQFRNRGMNPMHCLRSAFWWRSHWEKMALVDVELADSLPDGWKLWLQWQNVVAPENLTEIRVIESDAGELMGCVRAVARLRKDIKPPDIIHSVPTTYTMNPSIG